MQQKDFAESQPIRVWLSTGAIIIISEMIMRIEKVAALAATSVDQHSLYFGVAIQTKVERCLANAQHS